MVPLQDVLQKKHLVTLDVGGLNRKRHFDVLRDKLGTDVAPKELKITKWEQKIVTIFFLLNLIMFHCTYVKTYVRYLCKIRKNGFSVFICFY